MPKLISRLASLSVLLCVPLAVFAESEAAASNQQPSYLDELFAGMNCEDLLDLAQEANHQSGKLLYQNYVVGNDLDAARSQLNVLYRSIEVGTAFSPISGKILTYDQSYSRSLAAAQQKQCDTSSYPLRPVNAFERVVQALDERHLGRLVESDEYAGSIERDGVTYNVKVYIIPFEQPYYVSIQRQDGEVIDAENIVSIADEYIQEDWCTVPRERRPNLDRRFSGGTHYLIGIAC